LYPGQRNNLDALCKRYKIDNTQRNLHDAMLDARLLAEVYLCMTGKQKQLPDFYEDSVANLNYGTAKPPKEAAHIRRTNLKEQHQLKIIKASANEVTHHQQYLKNLKERAGKCMWDEEG
jgi:DNA polymerase III subunit epsilon